MGKRKMIFYGVAALFAVSGVAALPSGNITGGVGCLVIAAVCAFAGAKGKAEQQADKEEHETFDYKETGSVSTGLGDLLKGLKL